MVFFLQLLINGVSVGAGYAMVAVGLSLIFGILEVVNFAQGEFYMVGAYVAWFVCGKLGFSYIFGILAAAAAVGILGGVTERFAIRPLLRRAWQLPIIATFGISLILQNGAIVTLTATPKSFTTFFSGRSIHFLGCMISTQRVLIIGVSAMIFLALHTFVQRTKTGKAMRAVSQNKEACRVLGIPIERVEFIAFVVSGALAGIGGALISPLINVFPWMGALVVLKAFAVVILGGFGNIKGAIYGALILGVAESLWAGYATYAFKDVLAFVVLIAVLLFKPHGLFGKKVGI